MKRSPMPRRKTPLRSYATMIRFGSKQRRDANEMREAEKDMGPKRCALFDICEHLIDNPHESCEGRLVRHHMLPRSRGGSNDATNLVWLCEKAHRWVHGHPMSSRAFGLLR